MRSIDCQHSPSPFPLLLLLHPLSSLRPLPLPSPTRAPLPSLALLLRFYFRARLRLFSLFFLDYFFYLLVFLPVLLDPRLFSVMAQLFVYMGSKKRFLMADARMENLLHRDRIAGAISAICNLTVTCCTGKISYGIGIFGTGKSDGGTKCGDN